MRVYSKYRNKYRVYRVYEVFGHLLSCRQDPCSIINNFIAIMLLQLFHRNILIAIFLSLYFNCYIFIVIILLQYFYRDNFVSKILL